ncbi:MAG: methyltransferase domain-containing protein, partial [Thermomicrobiaceae bacterium]|nr:methyltransferase domain-containing protein [Thermomicrobiaceae bacterium]
MSDPETLRLRLVEELRFNGALTDEAVARAFRAVPREVFVPGVPLEQVYRDEAIVTKRAEGVPVSSSSQPAVMAIMLELLDVRPGMQVLEIGAGTGYNAALLRELTHEWGRVVTVDIDPEVVEWARERLAAAGYPDVAVVRADGADGYAPLAPYDRIELTVGADDIAPAWLEQLRPGGVIVLPLRLGVAQVVVALERQAETLRSRAVRPGGFMAMRGQMAPGRRHAAVAPGVAAEVAAGEGALDRLRDLLGRPPRREVLASEPIDPLPVYATLRDPARAVSVWAEDRAALGFQGGLFGYLDAAAESLCLLTTYPAPDAGESGQVRALTFGRDAAREALLAAVERWRALGSPAVEELTIAAHPRERAPEPPPGAAALDTRGWRL